MVNAIIIIIIKIGAKLREGVLKYKNGDTKKEEYLW